MGLGARRATVTDQLAGNHSDGIDLVKVGELALPASDECLGGIPANRAGLGQPGHERSDVGSTAFAGKGAFEVVQHATRPHLRVRPGPFGDFG